MNEMERLSYRPRLSYFHANAKGTGTAIRFELHPATADVEGFIFASIAAQATIGSREKGTRIFPRFDWKNCITVKLNLDDLARILEVFRGITENISDGKGLYHMTEDCNTIIKLEHRIEPANGYYFSVSRKRLDALEPQFMAFHFSCHQALGLSTVIEHSLGLIAFGVPRPEPLVVSNREKSVGTSPLEMRDDEITEMDSAVDF